MKLLTLAMIVFFLTHCARAPIKSAEEAFRPVKAPELKDDLDLESMVKGIDLTSDQILKRYSESFFFSFGKDKFSRDEYLKSLKDLRAKIFETYGSADRSSLHQFVQENFQFYEVYGQEKWGDAFMTSYYEPEIEGSKKKTAKFSQPLYKKPADIVEVSAKEFDPTREGRNFWVGRLAEGKTSRGNPLVIPYYSREDIDSKGVLSKKGLELVWVDPIDAFFLQIQGSGTIKYPDGSHIRVGFKDGVMNQNGYAYVPIGKFMTDKIPLAEITLGRMETVLRSLNAEDRQNLLNKNPSYVFFDILSDSAMTNFGIPAVDGRSIATDANFFTKGTLAFLIYDKPVFEADPEKPAKWEPSSRFVFDHDTGGAIKGPGRLDLFWGRGSEAKKYAGVIKNRVKLFYLAPKKSQ